jgi:hypothetical protein
MDRRSSGVGRLPRFELMPHWHFPKDRQKAIAIVYLVIVPIVIVVLLLLVFFNWRHERDRTLRQTEANRKQIAILHNALAEACHASTIQYGINTALLYYIQGSPDANSPGAKIAVDSLAGYSSDLLQLTSCQRIEKP